MKLNYRLNVLNSKIDRLKKQSMLRTNASVQNPTDERHKIKFLKIKEINI